MSGEFFAGAAQGLQQGTQGLSQAVNQDRDRVQRQPLLNAQQANLEATTATLPSAEEAKSLRTADLEGKKATTALTRAQAARATRLSTPEALDAELAKLAADTGLANAQAADVPANRASIERGLDLRKEEGEKTRTLTKEENEKERALRRELQASQIGASVASQERTIAAQEQAVKNHQEFLREQGTTEFLRGMERDAVLNERQFGLQSYLLQANYLGDMTKLHAQMLATPGMSEQLANRAIGAAVQKMGAGTIALQNAIRSRDSKKVQSVLSNIQESVGKGLTDFLSKVVGGDDPSMSTLELESTLDPFKGLFDGDGKKTNPYASPRPEGTDTVSLAEEFGTLFKDQEKGSLSATDAWLQALNENGGNVVRAAEWLSTGGGSGLVKGLYGVVNGTPFLFPDHTSTGFTSEMDATGALKSLEFVAGEDFTPVYNEAIKKGAIPAGADLKDPATVEKLLDFRLGKIRAKLKRAK